MGLDSTSEQARRAVGLVRDEDLNGEIVVLDGTAPPPKRSER